MEKSNEKELRWDEAVDRLEKSVFRIYAGNSAGTGFIVSLGYDRETSEAYAYIATAWHVLADLPQTQEDIKIVSVDKQKVLSSDKNLMAFYPLGDIRYDTALIMVKTGEPLIAENDLLAIFPYDLVLARGADIGWLGFPGLVEPEMCFFHGFISGYLSDSPTYLVDGVAINGVSGGPAFNNQAQLIGLVSAYIPNQIDKNITLPGLMALTPISAIRYWMEHRVGAAVKKNRS